MKIGLKKNLKRFNVNQILKVFNLRKPETRYEYLNAV